MALHSVWDVRAKFADSAQKREQIAKVLLMHIDGCRSPRTKVTQPLTHKRKRGFKLNVHFRWTNSASSQRTHTEGLVTFIIRANIMT